MKIRILTTLFIVFISCKNATEKKMEQSEIVVDSIKLKNSNTKKLPNNLNTIHLLEKSVRQDWKKENPKIIKTKPSFFKEENQEKYLIFEINFNGKSFPYSWDCDLSILKHLSKYDKKIVAEERKWREMTHTFTTIEWKEDLSTLIWTKDKVYKTKVTDWNLPNYFDCPGTISFPSLRFEKIFELPNARTNKQKGIGIFPFDKSLSKITETETELFTVKNNILKGLVYDINNDKINDIFIYYQELDEEGFTGYRRLYINVNGIWTCKWIEYYEECI